ncbi:MAG: RluA family pseudouridine synthase [Rhodothermales bacterium]
MTLDVRYLDNHLLVINKPAGVLVQEDHTGDPDLLSIGKAYLKERFDKPGNVFLGLVHRLDRPASGVMVFARTSKAASRLSQAFRERTPEKRYLALVEGRAVGGGTLVDHLVKEDRQVRIVRPDYPKAQRAELTWRALEERKGLTLVEVKLKTGRPHQIRVQLAHLGFPILGDLRYDARRELDGRNLALHCYCLGLEHPTQKEWMAWEAPPPATWEAAFGAPILFPPDAQ